MLAAPTPIAAPSHGLLLPMAPTTNVCSRRTTPLVAPHFRQTLGMRAPSGTTSSSPLAVTIDTAPRAYATPPAGSLR